MTDEVSIAFLVHSEVLLVRISIKSYKYHIY